MSRELKHEHKSSSRKSKRTLEDAREKIKSFHWTERWPKGVTLDEWKYNEYFMELFTHEDEVVKSFLLDWLAFIVQNNNSLIKRYLLIRDRSGGSLSHWFLRLITIISLSLDFPVLIRTKEELDYVRRGSLVILITNDQMKLDGPDWLKLFELRTEINMIVLVDTLRKFELVAFPYYSTFETSLTEVNPRIKVESYAKNYLLKELMNRDITDFTKWISGFMVM